MSTDGGTHELNKNNNLHSYFELQQRDVYVSSISILGMNSLSAFARTHPLIFARIHPLKLKTLALASGCTLCQCCNCCNCCNILCAHLTLIIIQNKYTCPHFPACICTHVYVGLYMGTPNDSLGAHVVGRLGIPLRELC